MAASTTAFVKVKDEINVPIALGAFRDKMHSWTKIIVVFLWSNSSGGEVDLQHSQAARAQRRVVGHFYLHYLCTECVLGYRKGRSVRGGAWHAVAVLEMACLTWCQSFGFRQSVVRSTGIHALDSQPLTIAFPERDYSGEGT